MSHLLIRGDARRIPLADRSVHCVVTSPPYWALRDYGVPGQLGLEPTPEAYVAAMVGVFREVRRVLRDDGTLWLNLGDSYATGGGSVGRSPGGGEQGREWLRRGFVSTQPNRMPLPGLKPKDLIGIPWMLAFALRADGWYLRSEVIWSKPSPMPESVRDRPTKSHEQVFMLTKGERYFYDCVAISEPATYAGKPSERVQAGMLTRVEQGDRVRTQPVGRNCGYPSRRNKRSVWSIASFSFKGAHFATMPPKLAATCIKAGTSARGCCPRCGAPWVRRVKRRRVATRPGVDSKVYATVPVHPDSPVRHHNGDVVGNRDPQRHTTEVRTVGWESSCTCLEARHPVPCVVFDPFAGVATTLVAADALGRHGIATELSQKYLGIARRRLCRPHARVQVERPGTSEDMPLFPAGGGER